MTTEVVQHGRQQASAVVTDVPDLSNGVCVVRVVVQLHDIVQTRGYLVVEDLSAFCERERKRTLF